MLNGYIIRFLSKLEKEITVRIFIKDKEDNCNYEIDISPFNGSAFKKPPIGRIYFYIRNEYFNIFIGENNPDYSKLYNVRIDNIVDSSKLLEILTVINKEEEDWTTTHRLVGQYCLLNNVMRILESYD